MVIPEFILVATVGADLYKRLERHRPASNSEMPWVYREDNPKNQPPNPDNSKHLDWFMCKDTPREHTARRAPLPFKIIDGPYTEVWEKFDPAYPLSPGMETRTSGDGFQVLTPRGGYGLVKYATWVDNAWRPCFKKFTWPVDLWIIRNWKLVKVRYRFSWYFGFHQDNNPTDLMCYIEPFAMSFKEEE